MLPFRLMPSLFSHPALRPPQLNRRRKNMVQLEVLGFQHLDHVATVVQSAGEPSTGLVFLDRYSIIVLGDLARVRRRPNTCISLLFSETTGRSPKPTAAALEQLHPTSSDVILTSARGRGRRDEPGFLCPRRFLQCKCWKRITLDS